MTAPDLGLTEAYDYPLPEHLIARYPAERRDESRLLVVGDELRHLRFSDLPELLAPGDLLVLNESRVIPVRLLGRKPTGAECEVLLIRPAAGADEDDPRRWEALVRPGSKLKPGRRVVVSDELEIAVEEGTPEGGRIVRLETDLPVAAALERFGHVPLPPYIDREDEPIDRERYQTVYARDPGSVAAPTAGLHFTHELLAEIEAMGVGLARVTLHVGPGTFRPVEAARLSEHRMHRERWSVSTATSVAVARTKERGGRVWAVGTTVVRTLESAAACGGELAGSGDTDLFIAPGYDFRVVDALITNFHLPRSTLLMLVSAFAGWERVMAAYEAAVREGYRFYSYGDAMALTADTRR